MSDLNTSTFFENLEEGQNLDAIVNDLSIDQVTELMHIGRNRVLQDPDHEASEIETRAIMLLVRKFRGARATRKTTTKKKEAPSLDSLLDM